VAQAVIRGNAQSVPSPELAFLAADVGGTHARIGLVSPRPDGHRPVTVLEYRRYACAEWPSLTAVLKDFVSQLSPGVHVDHCAVASAGYVLGDAIVNDNLPWPVSIRDIRETLGISTLAVINDFEAVAYATQFIDARRHHADHRNQRAANGRSRVGDGAGHRAGFGGAVAGQAARHGCCHRSGAGCAGAGQRTRDRNPARPCARASVRIVRGRAVRSRPGQALSRCARCAAAKPSLQLPADYGAALVGNRMPQPVEALNVFCGLLGSFVGDLVLLYGARGGAYLAGGILPQIQRFAAFQHVCRTLFQQGRDASFLATGTCTTDGARPAWCHRRCWPVFGQSACSVMGAKSEMKTRFLN
jgi:glucokinase